jgi:hypothetical protein
MKDRPPCPRCGGVVHKRPTLTHWYPDSKWPVRYVCRAGKKERTCGYYWQQAKSGDIFFEPTEITEDGYLDFQGGPLHHASQSMGHKVLAIVRPAGTGIPESELLYACPRRPDPGNSLGMRDWPDDFKEFLRQHQDVIVNIPPDVLDPDGRRPVYWDRKLKGYREWTAEERAEYEAEQGASSELRP